MTPSPIILIHGTRQSGKDTLASTLHSLNPHVRITHFADALKADLAPFVRLHFDLDIWAATGATKELLRSLMISYGMAQRALNPDYWVEQVINQIDADEQDGESCVWAVPDTRFPNEVRLMRETFPGRVRLIDVTREGAPSPTEEEEKHYRQVAAMADRHLHWGVPGEDRLAIAREVLEWLQS